MEVTNISSYYEFLEHLGGYPRSDWCPYYFRGINASYKLIPSIGYDDVAGKVSDYKSYEKCLMSSFYKEIYTKYGITQFKENDWEIWFLARHFGLKSRLIDFTKDDRIAIQFAMESSMAGTARVYCLNRLGIDFIQDDELCRDNIDSYTYNKLCLIHHGPLYMENEIKKLGLDRIFIQMGNFLYQPLETIHHPITNQIPEKYWKVFEISNTYFDKIKNEILKEDGKLMDKSLLKKQSPLDNTCRNFNNLDCLN